MLQVIQAKLQPYRFKSLYNLNQRRGIFQKLTNSNIISTKHDPNQFCVILVEPSKKFIETFNVDTTKKTYKTYVVKRSLKAQQLAQNIRNSIKLNSNYSFYMYTPGKILMMDIKLGDLSQDVDEDGFLYIQYGTQDSF